MFTRTTLGSGLLADRTYDDASNITGVTDNVTPTESITYAYDQLNRLTGMQIGGTAAASYTYNQIGNLTSKIESYAGMSNTTNISAYSYPGNGSARPHAVTSTAGTPALTLGYDANGNLASQGSSAYTYDAENRLKTRSISGGSYSYTYDGADTMVKRTNTADGTWTVYIGGVYEVTNTGAVTKYYNAIGRTIAMRQSGTLFYLLGDQLGGNVSIVDGTGMVVATEKYWPFGGTRLSTGTTPTDKLYTGQQQEPGDGALGLYNYKARFYSTVLGRFVSVDPVAGKEGRPQCWNAYSYVVNNPVRNTDPTGKRSLDEEDARNAQADLEWALRALAAARMHSEQDVQQAWAATVPDPAPPASPATS